MFFCHSVGPKMVQIGPSQRQCGEDVRSKHKISAGFSSGKIEPNYPNMRGCGHVPQLNLAEFAERCTQITAGWPQFVPSHEHEPFKCPIKISLAVWHLQFELLRVRFRPSSGNFPHQFSKRKNETGVFLSFGFIWFIDHRMTPTLAQAGISSKHPCCSLGSTVKL